MHTNFTKGLGIAALLLMALMTRNTGAAAAEAPENYQMIDGVAIYLGLMPTQIIQGHLKGHPEAKMHGGAPAGGHRDHVVVALFDDDTGRRIENAKVTAAVMELGLSPERKILEPMRIAGTITYGNYFEFPDNGVYHIQVQIQLPGVSRPIEATFTHRHVAP